MWSVLLTFMSEYLQALSESLDTAVSQLSALSDQADTSASDAVVTAAEQNILASLLITLPTAGCSIATLTSFPGYWKLADKLAKYGAKAEIQSAILRHEYLGFYQLAFHWLEGLVDKAMEGISDKRRDQWYHHLARDVCANLKANKHQQITYDPANYSPTLMSVPDISSVQVSVQGKIYTEPEVLAEVFEHLMVILAGWLGFPKDKLAYPKARFLSITLSYTSHGILYLPATYTAFQALHLHVLPSRFLKVVRRSTFENYVAALKTLPITKAGTDQHNDLRKLESIYAQWYTVPSPLVDKHLGLFLHFIRSLLPLLDLPGPVTSSTGVGWVAQVSGNADFYLPFRQRAPSLYIAQAASPGPYDPRLLCSRGAFFSSLVFRAVTYSAPVVLDDKQVYFPSFEVWKKFYDKAKNEDKKPASYFADMGAYGTSNRHRDPGIVEDLWKASAAWEPFMEDSPTPSAISVYQFLMGLHPKSPRMSPHHKFRNVGPLTAYLLVADYVQAGLIPPLSLSEIAAFVHTLNKGALKGLRLLGLLPLGLQAVSVQDVLHALEKLMECLQSNLGADTCAKIELDWIMIEHALCKYSRLNNVLQPAR